MTDQLVTRYFNSFDGKGGRTIESLPKSEELKLFRQWKNKKKGGKAALDKLILANLKFVVKCANKFSYHVDNKAIDINDLIQAGNEGLMQAIKHFKPSKNCRLITYGVHWINAYIRNFVYANVSTVRVSMNDKTKSLIDQRWTAFSLLNGKDADALSEWRETFKSKYKVSEKIMQDEESKVQTIGSFTSMDKEFATLEGDGSNLHNKLTNDQSQSGYLVENKEEQDLIRLRVRAALKYLPSRNRDILKMRFGIDNHKRDVDIMTMKQCGKKYKVSRQAIDQVEKKALVDLKRILQKDQAIMEIIND